MARDSDLDSVGPQCLGWASEIMISELCPQSNYDGDVQLVLCTLHVIF